MRGTVFQLLIGQLVTRQTSHWPTPLTQQPSVLPMIIIDIWPYQVCRLKTAFSHEEINFFASRNDLDKGHNPLTNASFALLCAET